MKQFIENVSFTKKVEGQTEDNFGGRKDREDQKTQEDLEMEEWRKKAQRFVDSYQRLFTTFAKDISLSFKISNRFFINLEKGEVNLDVKWFREKGFSQKQILWACLHELEHFRDLSADHSGVMKNFEYIQEKAKETGKLILAKWEEKYGQSNPDFVENLKKQRPLNPRDPSSKTMSAVERAAYDIHHTFYNIFDDINDNNNVSRKVSAFEEETEGGQETKNLYQEKLFAKNDYSELPLHLQFVYKLIREEMVKDEKVVVSEEVQNILEKKILFQGKEYLPTEIVEFFIKPRKGRETLANQRYFVLKKTLEPIFQELVRRDLEKWDPQKPEKQDRKGKGESGEGSGSANPFEKDYQEYKENNPDQIDGGEIEKWAKKSEQTKNDQKAKEAQVQAEENKTAEERAKNRQEKMDKIWCEKNKINYNILQQFRKIEAEVEPYLQDLSNLWQKIIFGTSRKIERGVEGHFKTGTELDVQKAIEEWPNISEKKLDDVRIMKRTVSKEVLIQKPELIRVRLVGDMSGSMNAAKKKILQQCFVLLLSSLREFNNHLNLTRSQTKSKLEVDTEGWVFGSEAQKVKRLRSEAGMEDEQVEIVRIFEKLQSANGMTHDEKALLQIKDSLSGVDLEKIAQEKIMEIVFEITDGGSSDAEATSEVVSLLENAKVIVKAFQIGNTSVEEKKTFNEVWNVGRTEKLGEIVGENIENLLPAVAEALKSRLSSVRL